MTSQIPLLPPQPMPPSRGRRATIFFCTLAFALFLLSLFILPIREPNTERNLAAIRAAVRAGEVLKLTVVTGESRIQGTLRGASIDTPGGPFESAVPTDELLNDILGEVDAWNLENPERSIEIEILATTSLVLLVFLQTLPWLLFAGILVWFLWRQSRQMSGGGAGYFGRSKARLANGERPRVTFADVAGVQEAKDEVFELIQFLRDPGRFRRLGGRIPRGVLLVGPPGTGKTLLAKAVAGEARVPFFSISGSDFVEMFVGVGASRVRDLFRQARENSPCIIFLDEIDAVGRRRGATSMGGAEEREQTLNAILVEMDGFDSDSGVIVIAASNRPDVLDPALMRPGRFDREISVDLPDMEGRLEILRVHTRAVPIEEDLDLESVARGTPGFSGAELEAIVNEAALIAALAGQDKVVLDDLEEARDKVRWGRAKVSRHMVEEDRRVTAYHEAGHAIIAQLLDDAEPLHKVTIIPRGPSLGSTMQLPQRDRYQWSLSRLSCHLMVLMGGRIAEARFCGDISSGASNDLERASALAWQMVCEWGMSARVGPVVYQGSEGRGEAGIVALGAETRRVIDEEVRRLVEQAYAEAERIIERHQEDVERIAQALLESETLNGDEVDALIEGERQPQPVAVQ